jgi:hypothetical protein
MKLVSLALVAALASCKPDSKPNPAPSPSPSEQAPAPRAHTPGARPSLPSEAVDNGPRPELPGVDNRRRIDTDGDGVVSPEEREAARAARAQRMQERLDANHDGKVTPDELAAAGSASHGPRFADPKAVDTNNDGEISPEELQQALVERRRQWRASRLNHGSDATGSDE